jgi:hypothetical protein
MNTEKLTLSLSLISAETDPPLHSLEYQQGLEELATTLGAQGTKVSSLVELEESAGSTGTPLLGTFTIELAKAAGPTLAAVGVAVAAWLQGRYGRKARLKIGDIEAEARTVEEVTELIARAKKFRQPAKNK